MAETGPKRVLGVTVLGDFLASEGVDAIVRNLAHVGATAVAVNPTVTAPAEEGVGSFQPPIDAGSSPRVFDRPLWGKHALWVRSGPSFRPNALLYADCPYPPRQPNDLTDEHGPLLDAFIRELKAQGVKVYLQIGAVQPTGLRDEDKPRLPDGRLAQERMANTGSLASGAIRAYNRAYVRDLLDHYPDVDGIRPDWPEYPCYKLDEAFADFSPHVERWAGEHGFDFQRIRTDIADFYGRLHGKLTSRMLADFGSAERGVFSLLRLLAGHPGVADWFRMKRALSVDLLQDYRNILDECGGTDKELSAHAFMPPYSFVTGFDFTEAAKICSSISPKLYTMHWSLMVNFWGEALVAKNAAVAEQTVVRALVGLMDLADDAGKDRFCDYGYPAPDEPHPIPNLPQRRKIDQVLAAVDGQAEVWPLVHGYGPLEDFERRLRVVAESPADGIWINRYGYLSDEKLEAIRVVWRVASA